ncbi:MAG: YfhO family protein, partial [Ruminococcus sp.]|nr:YfhO family protein [Ruminococcus sp.]
MENFRKKAAKALPYIAAPFAVMAIILVCYQRRGIFPFGKGTVAWCDMSQQVIPLLCDLKDMLSGKAGIFLNLQNAGGMNMWGVIFFFLASPFSLLVMFVKKVDMIYFANILVMLKLMTCSVTSVFFLRRRMSELPKLWCVTLSILYAFSGYAMLYYQNVIWLDMMYLFPLLMWSFGELIDKKRVAPYTTVLTLMMVVNYYISYMVVIFTLMFMGIVCFRYREQKKYRQ